MIETYCIRRFRSAHRERPSLRIATMLSSAEGKIGPKQLVRAWNLPLAGTCCNGKDSIATPVCRAVCYVDRMTRDRPLVVERAKRNLIIARRDDFAELMTGAILDARVKFLKLHLGGDFFSRRYIEDWNRIVSACSDVTFWCYTRAWRRADWIPVLTDLAAHDNMSLLLSCDTATGAPPEIPNTRTSWLADTDGDEPPVKTLVVFRASNEAKTVPLKVLGGSTVCPHQSGVKGGPVDCLSCKICL